MPRLRRSPDLVVFVFSTALGVLLLGPALGPGYVLSYDMVWVPDLAVRSDFFGLGSALPRAVPSDATIAVLGLAVPTAVLQKVVLLGALVGGGVGAARLAPADVLAARLWAAALWSWNPFVVERLLIGHWPVLVGYAALPWIVVATTARRHGEHFAGLWALLVVGSLSASAGVVTAVVALATGLDLRRPRERSNLLLVLGVVGANAPWLVAGLLRAPEATGGSAGTEAFAISGSAGLPAPVVALGLGGIWNVDVAAPRPTAAVLLAVVLLVLLAVVGSRPWIDYEGRRLVVALGVCWVVGLTWAVLGWAVPALPAALASLPGGGLLRDGGRTLGLCAPALVAVTAHGVAGLLRRRPTPEVAGWTIASALLPVALLPGAAWGVGGRFEPATYPASWSQAREAVDRSSQDGDVLVLPLTSYRAPAWNQGRPVLDPLGRYLPRNPVVADDLVVSGVLVPGEDPRVRRARSALRAPDPQDRARRLADLGIGLVATDLTAAGPAPTVAGEVVHRSADLVVVGVPEVRETTTPLGVVVGATSAWAVWGACLMATPVAWARRRRRSRRSAG